MKVIIIIIITITLLLYQLQYYSHCYYKFWQYYAKYAYHTDKDATVMNVFLKGNCL